MMHVDIRLAYTASVDRSPRLRPNKSNGILTERATETDLPSIKLLLAELVNAMDNAEGFNIETATKNCRRMLKDTSYHMLVARDSDGYVAGFVNFTTRRTILHPAPSGLIDELVVSSICRRRGIGRLLVLAAIEECRRLGCCEVEVSTEKSNIAARRFYKSCGFDEDATLLEMDLAD